MEEATWNQCVGLSLLWFKTTQLASVIRMLGMEEQAARFILEHDEWCRRQP
jgi:hypothetical protein